MEKFIEDELWKSESFKASNNRRMKLLSHKCSIETDINILNKKLVLNEIETNICCFEIKKEKQLLEIEYYEKSRVEREEQRRLTDLKYEKMRKDELEIELLRLAIDKIKKFDPPITNVSFL